jgi:cell division protein FtsB
MVVLALWILFFDSHNVWDHWQQRRLAATLRTQNDSLKAGIDHLQQDLQALENDEVVEAIAREQYGMRRPGETVYPVKRAEEGDE